jgi:hypothetical protein
MRKWLSCVLFIFLILLPILLSSCIGIESDILIRPDGSGVLKLSYTVSQYIKNIDAGRSEKQLPLPINEDEFRRSSESIEGLQLRDLDRREDEENIYIEAEFEFDSVEAVNALGREGEIGITLESRDQSSVFRQLIYPGQEDEEIGEDSLDMVETFFEGYELIYSVTVPEQVLEHSLGVLSEDGRTVTYTIGIPEILKNSEPLVLEVVW